MPRCTPVAPPLPPRCRCLHCAPARRVHPPPRRRPAPWPAAAPSAQQACVCGLGRAAAANPAQAHGLLHLFMPPPALRPAHIEGGDVQLRRSAVLALQRGRDLRWVGAAALGFAPLKRRPSDGWVSPRRPTRGPRCCLPRSTHLVEPCERGAAPWLQEGVHLAGEAAAAASGQQSGRDRGTGRRSDDRAAQQGQGGGQAGGGPSTHVTAASAASGATSKASASCGQAGRLGGGVVMLKRQKGAGGG